MSLQLFVALSILCGYYFEDGTYLSNSCIWEPIQVANYNFVYVYLGWAWTTSMVMGKHDATNHLLTDWLTESVCPSDVYTNDKTQNNVHDSLHEGNHT